ncbi:MAG TPA: mannitol dehydrogenase family protein, partial [Diaminobutyricibacter sp.]
MTIALTQHNLDAIAALGVPVPRYDRRAVSPRILHVGVGGFHRAHMARYTDDVAASGGGWGICGVGLLDADRRMADALGQQDGLYTLVERDNDGSMPRVVGSIVEYGLV